MRERCQLAKLRVMSLLRVVIHTAFATAKRRVVMLALLTALSLVASADARPLTTAPQYVLAVHVMITDTRIVVDHHSAPRGVEARFVIKNTGTRAHNFTLRGRTSPTGVRQAFSRTLKPRQRAIESIFLDVRGRIPYFDGLQADRGKAAMRGFFVVK
jgi:hypothetical protein